MTPCAFKREFRTTRITSLHGSAWPGSAGDGKTVMRASYGIFYDHPLLGLYFLGDASDGSKTGQLLFAEDRLAPRAAQLQVPSI